MDDSVRYQKEASCDMIWWRIVLAHKEWNIEMYQDVINTDHEDNCY